MSRVRRVTNQWEMEKRIDEYITRGYRIKSQGEYSTRLKKRDWGDSGIHLILVILTVWWSFGFMNALYGIYRYATAEEIVLKVDGEHEDES